MSERLNEYLAREASEYLDQMSGLLSSPGAVDPEQLLRLARGVRGSAQMAGADTLASVAERLEDAARAVVSHSIVWSEEIRGLALQTVHDLQVLLRALNRWGPQEEARVRSAIERWHDLEDQEQGMTDIAPGNVVPIAALFYDDEGPHVLSGPAPRPAEAGGGVVPIEVLLFRGDDALREALALRSRLEALVQAEDRPEVRELLDQLFDLVRLGQSAEPGAA